jgi:hypothetical protein
MAKSTATSRVPAANNARTTASQSAKSAASAPARDAASNGAKVEPKILFQKYFKSVGPRTYAAQLKEAGNGNHFLVLTEGKRDPETGEVKKTKVFVYSEDFSSYFRMLQETVQFIKAHPVPEDIKIKRQRYWAKKEAETTAPSRTAPARTVPARTATAAAPVRPAKVSAAKTTNRRPARGR